MKTRFIWAILIASALVSCTNDKKSALTVLEIVKGRLQQSIESKPAPVAEKPEPVTAYDMIHNIRITLVTAPDEMWVMDQEGTVLYQLDSDMVGKNVFKDDAFAKFDGFQSACKTIAEADSGEVTYTFQATGASTPVAKTAFWQTLRTTESSWKIVYALEE